MKFKYTITALSLMLAMAFSSCGDSDKNVAQIGLWYATNVSRTGCTNAALNGTASCPSNGTSFSCVELNLRETSYTLVDRLDSNITNEVGTYKISDGNIQLCPTAPLGSCYDVPVANASSQNMTISLERSTGCTAVVELIKI